MTAIQTSNQQANSAIATATETLANAEFSLIENDGSVLARLRFPPGTLRLGVRKLLDKIEEAGGTIKKQECRSSDRHPELTSTWSQLLFQASLEVYQRIQSRAKTSNLSAVRACTAQLMQRLHE